MKYMRGTHGRNENKQEELVAVRKMSLESRLFPGHWSLSLCLEGRGVYRPQQMTGGGLGVCALDTLSVFEPPGFLQCLCFVSGCLDIF